MSDDELDEVLVDDVVQTGDVVIDALSGDPRKRTDKEEILQRVIIVLNAEYRYPLSSIERDVKLVVEGGDGSRRSRTADLVVREAAVHYGAAVPERIVVVQPPRTKPTDGKRGVALLQDLLDAGDGTEFGLWTNGRDVAYLRRVPGPVESRFDELTDFPGNGEDFDDLNRPDRRTARVPVTDDLRQTVLRCHDYLYGNQSMTAPRAFGEIVKLIFCKIYDEQQLRSNYSYQRQFWVGLTERNHPKGQRAVAERITNLFTQVKNHGTFRDVFKPADEIELQPKVLAWIAGELGRYQFLDAEVDVKGMAYEAIVATTMKRERGQFFTPRNVVEAMVEILAPGPEERVLDPACGSGRFLVACLERFRRQQALAEGSASEVVLRARRNSAEILGAGAEYAARCLFGIDVDPELKRAAKMNMLINNDGHGNLFEANSLEVTKTALAEGAVEGSKELGFGSFDVVLTNPPFGSKIPIDDPNVLQGFDLGHHWRAGPDGRFVKQEGKVKGKVPPEILFIERCWQWLRDGGRMGIVLPDGILGNPDNEPIRQWILDNARVLASIDLPVETFLPQVGVQASLLFLEKKSLAEINADVDDDYPIFMAVAEFIGHDRRDNPVYRRDPDGFDIYEEYTEENAVLRDGQEVIEARTLRRRKLADDLPEIAGEYLGWRAGRTLRGDRGGDVR